MTNVPLHYGLGSAAFLIWLLNFPRWRLFLYSGHQQWYGCTCVCSVSAASQSSDLVFAIRTGLNDTPHITNAFQGKALHVGHRPVGENQDIHNASLPKRQCNTNRNHAKYDDCWWTQSCFLFVRSQKSGTNLLWSLKKKACGCEEMHYISYNSASW